LLQRRFFAVQAIVNKQEQVQDEKHELDGGASDVKYLQFVLMEVGEDQVDDAEDRDAH